MEYIFSKIKFSLVGVLLAISLWLLDIFTSFSTAVILPPIWQLICLSLLFVVFGVAADWHILRVAKVAAAERSDIYRATVWGAHLVLNNFLNKLYLIQHYAIQNGAFTEELSESMGKMIQEAAADLLELSRVDPINAETIRESVSPK